jgi:drug/metabolite transporter (DMT)-like permease
MMPALQYLRGQADSSWIHGLWLWGMVVFGILAISCASVLIRLANAPTLTIAAYRLTIATAALAPLFACRQRRTARKWTAKALGFIISSGFFLALHFICWIHSLQKTSVASSVILVSTTPFFVALFSLLILREQLHCRVWLGMICTMLGSCIVAGTDLNFSPEALWGDLLALLGALLLTGYLLVGRVARRHLDVSSYAFGAYGAAAVLLIAVCQLTRTPLIGFSPRTYLILGILALVPQLIGHTTLNWALRYMPATLVALVTLGEPLGASILAYIFLGETIGRIKLTGFIMVGLGIFLAALSAPSSSYSKQHLSGELPTGIEVDMPGENR